MERALAKLVAYTLGSGAALFFASRVVTGVTYTGGWEILGLAGFAIALLNLAIAPILKILSLPLRILTFNLFSLVIDMAMVWAADVLLGSQLEIAGLIPLFWTTLFVAVLNFLLWTLILSPSFKS
jgi:putative membrane protein